MEGNFLFRCTTRNQLLSVPKYKFQSLPRSPPWVPLYFLCYRLIAIIWKLLPNWISLSWIYPFISVEFHTYCPRTLGTGNQSSVLNTIGTHTPAERGFTYHLVVIITMAPIGTEVFLVYSTEISVGGQY